MDTTSILITPELFALAESSCFQGQMRLEKMQSLSDSYTFSDPLTWEVEISNTKGALLVQGSVKGMGTTQCARCLKSFSLALTGEIEGFFLLDATKENPEDLDDDEFEVLPADKMIDVEPLIKSALLLQFPLVPLCKGECKGLCATCGSDLNDGSCGCIFDKHQDAMLSTHPFAVLKNLSFTDDDKFTDPN